MVIAVCVQTCVLFLTAVLVYWYTKETAGLRREMVRQNKIGLRPVVVPVFETGGNQPVLKLHNIGAGSAFNLRIQPIEVLPALDPSATPPKLEVRFESLSYLQRGDISEVHFSPWINGNEDPTYGDCAAHFFPGWTHAEKSMKILFDDVEGGKYEQAIRIKPTTFTSEVHTIELKGIQSLTV